MDPDAQHLEEISSIRDAMRQISQEAEAAVELLDVRIEEEHLDGTTEAGWLLYGSKAEFRLTFG